MDCSSYSRYFIVKEKMELNFYKPSTLKNQSLSYMKIAIPSYLIKLGCNQEDAEDITQDTFYKALKYIDGIGASKISSWLFRVAINKYYDLCRTKKDTYW